MKTLNNSKTSFVSSSVRFMVALTAIIALNFFQPVSASSPAKNCSIQQKTGNSLLLSIGEQMSGSQTITVENLISGETGWSGTWWSVSPTENMQNVSFANISGSTLPANSEIAIVTITDPVYGFSREFILGTDGGAVILILGDF
jgi:hypothetical protein